MKVKGGKKYYGEAIGIAMLDVVGLYPMIPGDVGNASTYNFPVRMKVIKGLSDNPFPPFTDANGNYNPEVEKTIQAVKELENDGVRAVVLCCGFFSLVQKVLVKAVNIPVFTSPLMMVPIIERMIRPDQTIGIVTASAKNLTHDFLEPVGITKSAPINIIGLENSSEFYATHMGGTKTVMDVDLLRKEVVSIVEKSVRTNPNTGAILLECTTLPSFAADIQASVNLPVFDYIGFINLLYQSLFQKKYKGFM
jgi:Asp/Glu/hydantoin racemase